MRLTDPNFQDTGVFSLGFLPKVEDGGLYLCLIKQQERKLKERIILLAILTVNVIPAAPIPHQSTLQLVASVIPNFAITKIIWVAPGSVSIRSEKILNIGTVAKLPQVQNSDNGAYVCMVHPWSNSSALFNFNVDVTVDADKVASFTNIKHGPMISTATQAQTSFPLTCPTVQGDYVLLYWLPPDIKENSSMRLLYQYDRWRGSTLRTEQSKRLQLSGPPYDAEAGSFSFLLTPGLKDGGLYVCKVSLNDNIFSQRTLLSVLKESGSVTTPSLLPFLSALLLLVPLVAAAVGVLLWRQKHISDRGIEQSLSVHSGEAENIYENPDDIRQPPPQGSVYMDLKPRGGDDVYKELERFLVSAGFRNRRSGRMAGWMWLRCVLGPHLQRIHRSPDQSRLEGRSGRRGWNYQPRSVEKHTDSILGWASTLWSLSYYSSPLLLCYLYRKGYICSSKLVPVSQYVGTMLVCLLGVACLRGWGRWKNSEYLQFISILEETKKNHTPANKKKLKGYDFDFSHWPSDFSWTEVSSPKLSKAGVSLLKPEPRLRGAADSVLNSVRTLPCHIISFLISHSFGRRMLYPGSVGLLQKAMRPMLQQGQARLIEEFDGQRNKLVACDGNEIDTMFVDRRRDGGQHGQTLVICCEGNAGFYEVGCMNTPLEGGYSVLGWNHPGFGGSTGVPFPQNEANAMDVVIQYAIHKLGFQLTDIVVYAWSIGGFTASWAVMSYPEIQSLVLDASFDDLLPLALKVMPDSWRPLVQHTVRQYMNLNNADQLLKYQGPVLLIRRTRDEIITTTRPDDIMSNRGNDLLLKLLQFRYPKIMTDEGIRVVRQWLGASSQLEEASVYSGYEVDDDWCVSVLQSYQADRDVLFPWSVGEDMTLEGRRQLALFLARKYMRNFETTHCTPLPAAEFHSPWRL
ncbi:phosphatidylserine lipase ABHD16A-like [Embiotoca jacksoni]|uniref:phosphatidylserine lipase ABHD16A-like n=1 Tax=Embiotoca jacksoni TaxID=100190 RepID=UPI003703CA84